MDISTLTEADLAILFAAAVILGTYIICLIDYLFFKRRIMEEITTIYPLFDDNQKIITQDKIEKNVDTKQIIRIDKYFNRTQFLSLANNYFTKIKHAYSAQNLTELSAFESNKLIKKQAKEVNNRLQKNETLKVESLSIIFSELYNFFELKNYYYLVVIISCRLIEYYSPKDDKEKINANSEDLLPKYFLLTFKRKKDIDYDNLEKYKSIMKTSNCPNCGAPTSVITVGTCDSCGEAINLTLSNWILDDIEKID